MDQWIVHVGSKITTDSIAPIFGPMLHLSKTEQEREQDDDTTRGYHQCLPQFQCPLLLPSHPVFL